MSPILAVFDFSSAQVEIPSKFMQRMEPVFVQCANCNSILHVDISQGQSQGSAAFHLPAVHGHPLPYTTGRSVQVVNERSTQESFGRLPEQSGAGPSGTAGPLPAAAAGHPGKRKGKEPAFDFASTSFSPDINQLKGRKQKKIRGPTLYNRFIQDELLRIKASQPEVSHKEAFKQAAQNWKHSELNLRKGRQPMGQQTLLNCNWNAILGLQQASENTAYQAFQNNPPAESREQNTCRDAQSLYRQPNLDLAMIFPDIPVSAPTESFSIPATYESHGTAAENREDTGSHRPVFPRTLDLPEPTPGNAHEDFATPGVGGTSESNFCGLISGEEKSPPEPTSQ
eukprot:CAMPEP_0177580956 /NCGR_PEP_ID=MMETSP0419_2-20121207/1868_1 /TAXON_ID=582737 /ORGANISM="Tetraselmis sp., Strain GSL018" /LENGTH=339 /DNA_ID=CAMNT_0019069921 /DNA_START=1433 /DNA_END=2451 /DNA_ORIENTATION=-